GSMSTSRARSCRACSSRAWSMTWIPASSRSSSHPPRSKNMCDEIATAESIRAATPAVAPGRAVDPIALEPVDEVVVTTLVDNVYDALLDGQETITRAPFAAGIAQAPQFESGTTRVGLMAEHGFSALDRLL